jgi:hypothetical protein
MAGDGIRLMMEVFVLVAMSSTGSLMLLSAAAQGILGANSENQIQIPNRAPKPILEGAQGNERSEIFFGPGGDLNSRPTVRVELIDPTPGGSLKIVDQNGRTVRAKVALEGSYSPKEVMAAK